MPKIKDIPKVDRPREKFLEKGADALSKSELLAIIIGSGIKGKNVQKLSEQIIRKFNKNFLEIRIDDLLEISGIGKAKALQIVASIALMKRIHDESKPVESLILSAKKAVEINSSLKGKKKEYLVCLYLNARNSLIKKEIVSIGTLDKSIIHPREIFGPAVELRAASIILVHNHPSGDPYPSEADREVFKKIVEAGGIMGIAVSDCIIVAENGFFSLSGELKKDSSVSYVSDGIQFSLYDLLIDQKSNENYAGSNARMGVMKFADLFAGIGGIKIGFEQAGFDCVFSNDFDKYCKITFDYNFSEKGKSLVLADISKVPSELIPDFGILTGGFPCQPFSIAGYRKGFLDKNRGNLFFDIIRILRDKKPKAFLLENVKNLKTHDGGKTFLRIYEELKTLGYGVTDKILNTMEYGNLPQNRERICIVGFLDKKAYEKFHFPEKIPLEKTVGDCLEAEVDSKYYYNGKPLYKTLAKEITKRNTVYQWRRKYVRENKNGVCPTLTANMGMGGHNVPLILDGKGIRKLTPRECANFQGFPKSFKLPKIADSSLYKQFGNSVSIPVIKRVAENIKKALE